MCSASPKRRWATTERKAALVAERFRDRAPSYEFGEKLGLFREMAMHLPYWVNHETACLRVSLVTLLILAFCAAILVLLSEHSQELYGIDELYGVLD